jgi:uncharacterized membrane protein YbhN (UPF0104 family)
MPAQPPPARRHLINIALSALALGLLAFTIYSNRDQIQSVFRRRVDPRLMAAAYLLYMTALVLTFVRWFILVRALGLPFRLRDAVRLGFIGNVFNLVIPGAVGGDLIKGAFLVREQSRKTQALASMVIDRALGLLGLFVLASVSGAFAWESSAREARILIGLAWAACGACLAGLAVAFSPGLFRPLLVLLAHRPRLHTMLKELTTLAASYRSRLGQVLLALVLAVACHAMFVGSFVLVDQALFPSPPTVGQHFVVVPLALFSTAVPLPFGALGVSEQVTDYLFERIGHLGGAIAMLGFRVIIYAAGLTSVVVYLFNLRQVRELRAPIEAAD